MGYLDDIAEKKKAEAARAAAKGDIDSLIAELKEVQLASLMNGNKSSVVLADSTDLGDKFGELSEKITKIIDEFRIDTSVSDKLGELINNFANNFADLYTKTTDKQAKDSGKLLDSLTKALEGFKKSVPKPQVIDFSKIPAPIVPAPIVKVEGHSVDLSPLQEAISNLKEPLNLNNYRPQDINDKERDVQYIGFLNPQGDWYIVENDIKNNSLRYVFGSGGYTEAFKKAASYEYTLLSEAVDALWARSIVT